MSLYMQYTQVAGSGAWPTRGWITLTTESIANRLASHQNLVELNSRNTVNAVMHPGIVAVSVLSCLMRSDTA